MSEEVTVEENCPICVDEIRHIVATPVECQHQFCRSCIIQWTKVASTCPLDRLPISRLRIYDLIERKYLDSIEVIPIDKRDEDNEDDFCEICNTPIREGQETVSCGLCDFTVHRTCTRHRRNSRIPWVCHHCDYPSSNDDEEDQDVSFQLTEAELNRSNVSTRSRTRIDDIFSEFLPPILEINERRTRLRISSSEMSSSNDNNTTDSINDGSLSDSSSISSSSSSSSSSSTSSTSSSTSSSSSSSDIENPVQRRRRELVKRRRISSGSDNNLSRMNITIGNETTLTTSTNLPLQSTTPIARRTRSQNRNGITRNRRILPVLARRLNGGTLSQISVSRRTASRPRRRRRTTLRTSQRRTVRRRRRVQRPTTTRRRTTRRSRPVTAVNSTNSQQRMTSMGMTLRRPRTTTSNVGVTTNRISTNRVITRQLVNRDRALVRQQNREINLNFYRNAQSHPINSPALTRSPIVTRSLIQRRTNIREMLDEISTVTSSRLTYETCRDGSMNIRR
ncbi:hypothetical protein SNEBB_001075 [Seison nebaliae]|nr:hypothetical protein SNEBB_001075 [Seison nebaliae]